MCRYVLVLAIFFAFCVSLCAACQQATSADSPQQEQPKQNDKGSNGKKKHGKHKGKADVYDSTTFSEAVADRVLSNLRDGLQGHSRRLVLSAFEADKMDGYLTFEDQIEAMMERYDSFRVHFRIAQSAIEDAKGMVLVDFEMEEIPRTGGAPIRRNGQVKFEMERGRKGWKIVDFNPRGFFS